jgi:hypothetical protein
MLCLSAQTKIDFRDGKSLTLKGKLAGTFAKPDFFDPTIAEKNIQSFYMIDGDTLEICVYSLYANKSFDDLEIYRIHKNQIDIDYLAVSEEKNDEEKVIHYSLSFSSLDDLKFQYKKYTIYSSVGVPKEFNTFTIYSNTIEGLDTLVQLIKN